MILAAFGAVRGDIAALDFVLDAIDREGIQTVLCTGDLAVGPHPNETIRRIQNSTIQIVQGESDRQLARFVRSRKRLEKELDSSAIEALRAAHAACSSANLEWLAELPRSRSVTVDGELIALFSGLLSSGGGVLSDDDDDQIFRRQREIVPAQAFVSGGAPAPFARLVDGAVFANPGNLAAADGRLRYTVVSTESEPPEAGLRSLPRPSGV